MLNVKRSMLTTRAFLYMVLTLVLFVAIGIAYMNFAEIAQANKNKAQASGSLDRLNLILNSLQPGWVEEFVGLVPIDWWLVSFSKDSVIAAPLCRGSPCVCICSKEDCSDIEKRYCKPLERDLKDRDTEDYVKTQLISSLTVSLIKDKYVAVSRRHPSRYENYKLSKGTGVDKLFEKLNAQNLVGLGECIENVSKNSGVPEELIMAVTMHETDKGKSSKVGKVCSNGPSKTSYNLFGITGPHGTTEEGYCKWSTMECGTSESIQTGPWTLISSEQTCTAVCDGEGEDCYWVKRAFRAYDNPCESIADFANLMNSGSKGAYRRALQENPFNLQKAAVEIGNVYAGEKSVWGRKVGDYITAIKKIA